MAIHECVFDLWAKSEGLVLEGELKHLDLTVIEARGSNDKLHRSLALLRN